MKIKPKYVMIIISILAELVLLVLGITKKITWKSFGWLSLSLVGLWVVYYVGFWIISKFSGNNVPFTPFSALPPELPFEDVLVGLKQWLTKSEELPYKIIDNQIQLQTPVFELLQQDMKYSNNRLFHIFEVYMLEGKKAGQIRTFKILANQKKSDIAKGNQVRNLRVSLLGYKDRPREFPDAPIGSEDAQVKTNVLNALASSDSDSWKSNPKILDYMLNENSNSQTQSLDSSSESDEDLHKSNVYKKSKGGSE